MSLTLDPALEARIQREVDLGHFPDADTVINAALDLLPSPEQEEWLQRNREALSEHLEESYAQAERGELYTEDQALEILRDVPQPASSTL